MMYENCLFEMKSCSALLVVMCYGNPAHLLSMVPIFCECTIEFCELSIFFFFLDR